MAAATPLLGTLTGVRLPCYPCRSAALANQGSHAGNPMPTTRWVGQKKHNKEPPATAPCCSPPGHRDAALHDRRHRRHCVLHRLEVAHGGACGLRDRKQPYRHLRDHSQGPLAPHEKVTEIVSSTGFAGSGSDLGDLSVRQHDGEAHHDLTHGAIPHLGTAWRSAAQHGTMGCARCGVGKHGVGRMT